MLVMLVMSNLCFWISDCSFYQEIPLVETIMDFCTTNTIGFTTIRCGIVIHSVRELHILLVDRLYRPSVQVVFSLRYSFSLSTVYNVP